MKPLRDTTSAHCRLLIRSAWRCWPPFVYAPQERSAGRDLALRPLAHGGPLALEESGDEAARSVDGQSAPNTLSGESYIRCYAERCRNGVPNHGSMRIRTLEAFRQALCHMSASVILVRPGCAPDSTSAALCISVLMADLRKRSSSGVHGAFLPSSFLTPVPPL